MSRPTISCEKMIAIATKHKTSNRYATKRRIFWGIFEADLVLSGIILQS
ncbi:hypothetical protein IJG01_01550 [Candidatus Saccharibacteria bacterium]|nr:hypothetical protein [Candidatus Saccharibacteria bacterium]